MPTSIVRGGVGNTLPLAQLAFPATYRANDVLIHPFSHQADGGSAFGLLNSTIASRTYPASNRALGFQFCLADPFTVMKVWWLNGATATTDNADVGVYTEAGTTLLVSGGSTLIATASIVQEKDCTDTMLAPGRYWCVYNQNGVTATPSGWSAGAAGLIRVTGGGWAQFAGAVPLGASFTPAALAGTVFPFFGIAGRTQVA